jgi:hypothetical protein
MTYVQAASGHGGWPMSVFLTPELKPFYGGTYYPPENTPGRIGFKNLLNELHKVWTEDRKGIDERAARSVEKLQEHLDNENTALADINHDTLVQKAYDDLSGSFDYHEGGFGGAPKFPRPTTLNLLMRIHRILAERKDKDRESESNWAMEMTVKTLRGMANGGMRDHVGGGFHRYSVDAYWHIPHYEKMLYDQAQLLTAYVEGWQITQTVLFEAIARSTVAYLKRDLRHKDGGFFSAEDADSLAAADAAHKTEGAFYVWKAAEIDELLGKENGSIFRYAYGARRDGNARPESDPQGELKGLNTLYRAVSFKKTGEFFKKSPRRSSDHRRRHLKLLSKPAPSVRARISTTKSSPPGTDSPSPASPAPELPLAMPKRSHSPPEPHSSSTISLCLARQRPAPLLARRRARPQGLRHRLRLPHSRPARSLSGLLRREMAPVGRRVAKRDGHPLPRHQKRRLLQRPHRHAQQRPPHQGRLRRRRAFTELPRRPQPRAPQRPARQRHLEAAGRENLRPLRLHAAKQPLLRARHGHRLRSAPSRQTADRPRRRFHHARVQSSRQSPPPQVPPQRRPPPRRRRRRPAHGSPRTTKPSPA